MRVHGVDLVDDYAWMRAPNWSEVIGNPDALPADIRAHLEAENAWADHVLAPTAKLRRKLQREIDDAEIDDGASVPEPDGPWAYYETFAEDADQPRYCRRPRAGGPETVVLDSEALANGTAYFDMQDAAHSPDHRLFAYAVDHTGSERSTIRIRDIASGRDLTDVVPDCAGSLAWSLDSRWLFYVRLDASHRPLLVYRHAIGTSAKSDLLVYAERDPAFDVFVGTTLSKAYVRIEIDGHHADETRLVDAARPDSAPVLVAPREIRHQYRVEHLRDRLFVMTTSQDAHDYRICECPVASPGPENWREIVPHRPGRRILDMVVLDGHLAWLERSDGLARILVRDLASGEELTITFDEPAYEIDLLQGNEQGTSTLRYLYQSMTTPPQVWAHDLGSGARTLLKAEQIGADYDPQRYVMRRIEAPAHDGAMIPVTVLHDKATALDGTAPLVLEGYGGYGDALQADFAYDRMLLVDRGFVFALAHVRGGEEKGFEWHEHGRHRHKPNSPKDFVSVARHLAATGYTAPGRIVAKGMSAGGMLVAAAANMAPDLFLALLADVPFVDVLYTMLDGTLPLTPGEWPEWGNPVESPDDFALIRSYCPYQNVRPAAYPHVLATSSLGDQRVGYWEPAKWVARLREHSTSDARILLKVDLEAGGHDGSASRSGSVEDIALEYAFVLHLVGGGAIS